MGIWKDTAMMERRAVWRSDEQISRDDLAATVDLFEATHGEGPTVAGAGDYYVRHARASAAASSEV